MGQNTKIEWCDASWPVVRGCDKISPGCKFCWAIKDAHRIQHNPNPKIAAHFEGLTVLQGGKPNWSGIVRIDRGILDWPKGWKKHKSIFVASSGDLFHKNVPFHEIDEVFDVMRSAPWHRYLVLTKRADVARSYFDSTSNRLDYLFQIPDVLIGFSAENDECFQERWEHMRHIAFAGGRVWCSAEPLLGPINAAAALRNRLRWTVIGGESGPGARPFDVQWARDIVAQCKTAEVPCFVKQLGAKPYMKVEEVTACGDTITLDKWLSLRDRKGGDPSEWPEDLRVREFPEVRNG